MRFPAHAEKAVVVAKFETGDLVVLVSGSMRMAVEGVDGAQVACVWCHEGEIFRDAFDEALLNKWEFREADDRTAPRGRGGPRDGERKGGGKPWDGPRKDGERKGGGKPYGSKPDNRDGGKPRGKTGWDGKPREKKYFRSDD